MNVSPILLGGLLLTQIKVIIIIAFTKCLLHNRRMLTTFHVSAYLIFTTSWEVSTAVIPILLTL